MNNELNNDLNFFENSTFFDNNVKKKIQNCANVNFKTLIKWSSKTSLKKPKKIKYIGNKKYVDFFLFYIFRNKEILDKLWNKCGEKFDKSFKIRMISGKEYFTGYIWELYLIYFLTKKNLLVKRSKKNEGPDIQIIYKKNIIWIECTCPKCGDNNFKVPKIEFDKIGVLPINEIYQRLKFALINKSNIYTEYIENKKLVSHNDKKYIAINTSDISQYGSLMDVTEPLLLKVSKEINFFENNKEIAGLIYSHKSIFDYNNCIEFFIIENNYSIKRVKCKI